jgi:hypothetical protein
MKTRSAALVIVPLLIATASMAAESALDAAKRISGKYTGQWKMYGIAGGLVVEKASWTDVLEASDATESKGKAFVEVTDVMTFRDGTTRTTKFIEGYVANADGSAGDRFYEIQGKTTFFKKLTDRDWVYQATPDPGELWFLGFDPKDVISASHVATKTTTYEGNLDTDHVTRLTTIQWRDTSGSTQTTQFISMKGAHARTPHENP